MLFSQTEFNIRCEWGEQGVAHLATISDAVVIVDVLSFSTCIEIATSRAAVVFPYRRRDESAMAFANSVGAMLASHTRSKAEYSLSPQSLLRIPSGTRLVLPSPNGSTLTLSTGTTPTFAGCLRNCRAIALAAQSYGRQIAVIPAGERWKSNGSLRPAFEDWVGAGAIISHLDGNLSPEARAAVAAFQDVRSDVEQMLKSCGSGKELVEQGFEGDVALASEIDVSECVPVFVNGAYVRLDDQTK